MGSVAAGQGASVKVLALTSASELDACVALQIAVWGYADGDVIPRRVFVVANHIGGQVFGATVDGVLAGFAMALPGFRDGEAYLHSHMLAVLPGYRDLGIGRRLKLAQRDDALLRGYRVMEWTFDPLEIKNAYFNLHRLGATCVAYEPNFYGDSSSPLQGGLPTDRLCARWEMGSRRVAEVLAGFPFRGRVAQRVTVPATMSGWKQDEAARGRALAAQLTIREQLLAGFAFGLEVVDFQINGDGDGEYLLGERDGLID